MGLTMIRFKKIISTTLFAAFVAAGLSACAPGKAIKNENPQLVASPDKASMLLAEAADRASTALETLAAVEQTRTPKATVDPIPNVPPELKRAITVNWIGPVAPIAKKLADRAGYRFQEIGGAPPSPIVVSIDAENMPVIDVMRSIGLQLGKRADIRVNGPSKAVEVHYYPQDGLLPEATGG